MIAPATHPVVHLVGLPGTARPTPFDRGRLSPALLLAHAVRHGHAPDGPVIVAGPMGADDTARACGVEPSLHIALPVGEPRLARPGLRNRLGACERLICWSDELAPLARRMAEEVHLISTDPEQCPLVPRHFARITTFAERDARLWRARGGAPVRANHWLTELAAEQTDRGSTSGVRAHAGIPEGTLLIASLADRPCSTDARGLAFFLSVLQTTGYPVCGLIPSVATNAHAALRHARGLGNRYPVLLTERPMVDLLGDIDLVVMPEEDQSGSSLTLEAVARARGCRVIRLNHRGKAGLKSTPGSVAPILETLDEILGRPEPVDA